MNAIDRSDCTARRHGDRSAYSWWRCRCPDAREDWRLYKKRLREGRQPSAYTDSTGTARRMQALVAIGYSFADLAARTPWGRRHVGALARHEDPACLLRTAGIVRDLYEQLSGTPGASSYAHRVAERYGWVPPLAWDDETIDDPAATPDLGGSGEDVVDEVAVRRALDGDGAAVAALNHAERLEVTRRLVRRGGGVGVVSERLRMSGHAAAKLVGAVRAEVAA